MTSVQQRYPIGPCEYPAAYTANLLTQYLLDIETFPMRLEYVVQHLDADQLQLRYREGGWTINQVIHHCGDSHMNAILRIKLALTDENPSINAYQEDRWAETADYDLPFNNTITMLFAIHRKLLKLLESLSEEQRNRTYFHTQYQRSFSINDVICLYAWHGNHHLAQIQVAITQLHN